MRKRKNKHRAGARRVVPSAPAKPPVVGDTAPAFYAERERVIDEFSESCTRPDAAMLPRKFGEARVYRLDGGFKVTIEGDAAALEADFAVSSEQDTLFIFTADAAVQRRVSRQSPQPAVFGSSNTIDVQTPVPRGLRATGSLSLAAPAGVGDPVPVPGIQYDGTTPTPSWRRSAPDAQDAALADVGVDMEQMAAAVGLS